jgi:hypothetical protein
MPQGDDGSADLAERLRFESLVIGAAGIALYIEIWRDVAQLETHVRSREYHRLLAIMETAAERPALRFNLVGETRGLAWVEQLRLGSVAAER